MSAGAKIDLRPEHVSLLVAWLASPESQEITGRAFDVGRGNVGVAEGWHLGPARVKQGLWIKDTLLYVLGVGSGSDDPTQELAFREFA